MNDRQITDVSTEFAHAADELDLVPEALKDLTAGSAQANAVRGGYPTDAAYVCENGTA